LQAAGSTIKTPPASSTLSILSDKFTAKSHVHNILEKLALSTRLQIAAFARRDESE
jgi:hypothetical protein